MKHLLTLALLAVSTAALAADEFDFYFADISILQDKKVQAELKVTETQRAAMNKHADWLNGQGKAIDTQVRSGKLTADQANKQMGLNLGLMKKKICDELSAVQLKRLREITLQRDGLLPLMDLKMGEKIGLTKAQTQKLRDSYIANDKKAKDIQSATFKPILDKYAAMKPKDKAEEQKLIDQSRKELAAAQEKIRPQLEALAKAYGATVDSTLSKEQKDAFAALKGKPFETK
jgi:hypothetical protein